MLDRLYAHCAWANHRLLDWYRGLPPVLPPMEGQAGEYCLKMLSHVVRAEAVWLARLRGEAPGPAVWDTLPAEELEILRAENEAAAKIVLSSGVDRVVSYKRFSGEAFESTVADILAHVCAHGMYHRGQVAAQAVRAGLPRVPSTDFIEFVRS